MCNKDVSMFDFPIGYSPSPEVKFDKDFLKFIKKDPLELQTFFECAINDENFWNNYVFKKSGDVYLYLKKVR